MKSPYRHILAVASLAGGLAGCSAEAGAPLADKLQIAVAPLTLPSLSKVCYDLRVTNDADGAGDVVFSQGTPGLNGGVPDAGAVCSTQYGNGGGGAISYIGPCDADAQEDADPEGERTNSVTVWFDGLYDESGAYLDPGGEQGWQNPCVDAFGAEVGCTLEVLCEENADALVEFNFTVMRQANQGFFDVAVNFEDIFCSAKLDTCYANETETTSDDGHIELLFGDDSFRDWTGVFAFACSAGPGTGVDTNLLMSNVVITCGDTSFWIDPTGDAGNKLASGTGGEPLHYGLYYGLEELPCGAGVDCNKAYWNLAFSLQDLGALGGDCTLAFSATANDGNKGFANGVPTAVGQAYPYVAVAAQLTSMGMPVCQQNPLNGADSFVTTSYEGALVGTEPPVMCAQFDGGEPSGTGVLACIPADCQADYQAWSSALRLPLGALPAGVCVWGQGCVDLYQEYADSELDPAPLDQDWATEFCLALTYQAVMDTADGPPVSQSRYLVEQVAADGSAIDPAMLAFGPVTGLTDDSGSLYVYGVPDEVAALKVSLFSGDILIQEEVVLAPTSNQKGFFKNVWNGVKNFVKSVVNVVLTIVDQAWKLITAPVCTVLVYKKYQSVADDSRDKYKHCNTACHMRRQCGLGAAVTASVLKEAFDEACSGGPGKIKELLAKEHLSGCGGFDWLDLAADNQGLLCGGGAGACETCCDENYPDPKADLEMVSVTIDYVASVPSTMTLKWRNNGPSAAADFNLSYTTPAGGALYDYPGATWDDAAKKWVLNLGSVTIPVGNEMSATMRFSNLTEYNASQLRFFIGSTTPDPKPKNNLGYYGKQ